MLLAFVWRCYMKTWKSILGGVALTYLAGCAPKQHYPLATVTSHAKGKYQANISVHYRMDGELSDFARMTGDNPKGTLYSITMRELEHIIHRKGKKEKVKDARDILWLLARTWRNTNDRGTYTTFQDAFEQGYRQIEISWVSDKPDKTRYPKAKRTKYDPQMFKIAATNDKGVEYTHAFINVDKRLHPQEKMEKILKYRR